jgi:hypothetical protein
MGIPDQYYFDDFLCRLATAKERGGDLIIGGKRLG